MLKVINTYKCKDGRVRAYCRDENNKAKVISYPRILMEESLGRPLEPYEDVHHVDKDTDNNSMGNLEIINHGVHQKLHASKYFDKQAICGFVKSHLFGLPKGNACIILIYGEVDIESFLVLENAVVVMVGKSSLGGIPWLNAD